ncbi:unnamed protein product [Didymodactylos carnosus]|uniref:Centrosomal protein of 131 kDa n=1 Tax=Didymodactylos carnosus TaxID=1234261 RepID=A0A8S2MJD2_9BILA|nr:unnamed protein product [Didymodactylos carnosus]CAF3960480.1 unnamed protein product [Didymodactylos carnosus]
MRRRMAEAALKRVLEQKKLEHQASAERTRELEKFTLLEQKRNREEKARNARLVTIKDTQRKRDQSKQQQDADLHRVRTPTSSNRGSYSSRTGIKRADSNSRTPRLNNDRVPSPMPPKQDNEQQNQTSSIGFEKVNKSISGGDISEHVTLISSTSSASKVTLNDVYETLRKLEQVEQFPLQRNESAYLNDSTLDASDTLAENNSRSSKPLESILSYLDQETQKTNDITIESVRSQKSTSRLHDRPPQPIRTSTVQLVNQQQQTTTQQQREDGQQLQHPPIPYNVRFANSDHTLQQHSNRSKDSGRQTPTSVRNASDRKLAQSLAMPHMQQTDSQRQYQISTPHKSLAINPSNTIHDEHNNNEEYSSQQRDSGILYDDQNMDKDDDIDDYATRTTQDVTQQILKLRMNNEEKQRTVFLLQQRLNQQRELNVRHAKEADREMMHRLQLQKEEYESAIKRHLTFIDQLIDDKKKLSERCEKVVNEIKLIDKKYSDKIRLLEDNHRIEIQKLKDVHEAAEKLRRERWIDEKTKKIKELTVRGLEPEIQKLISKHKAEIQKIKSINEAELLQSDERAAQRYVRMTEELRDQLEREKEQAIMRERDSARERYEKAIRDEEKAFTEQRRRLFAEIEEEKNRLAEQATKQRNELDKLRKDVEDNHRNAVDAMKREYEAARLEQERRHQGEIRELKEKLEIEKQSWEENYMKKQETNLAGKERELRDQMKRERDKEIEKVISQLETDTTMSKEEAERAAENRVKRIRDKYESELREVEYSERQTQERYNQLKAQYTEVEGDNERFKVIVKQKDTEINDIRKITDTLQKERERLSDIIRQEFADRLVLTEDENKRLKIEMAELRSRQQIDIDRKKEEIDTLQREKDQELEKVHEKIKQAITKKDEQVTQLRQQFESAVKRADHLEGLLEQQRKLISTPATANTTNQKKS